MVTHQPTKFGGPVYYGSRDTKLLGCIVISQYNVSTDHVTLWTEAHQRELHS